MDHLNTKDQLLAASIRETDPVLADCLGQEQKRRNRMLHLLAPAMLTPQWLRDLQSQSALTDLDAEGYVAPVPDEHDMKVDRYVAGKSQKYNPCGPIMESAEARALGQVKATFRQGQSDLYVNIHPNSGSSANLAAMLGAGDLGARAVAVAPSSGGHISHGASFHLSGRLFRFSHLKIDRSASTFPLGELDRLLVKTQPKIIVIGVSSYPRTIDWGAVADIRNSRCPGAILIADIAHLAGLVATELAPSPIPHVDVTTGVGYKSLGGPKSGFIICRSLELHTRIAAALFPGLQGSPRLTDILAMGMACEVATRPAFRSLIRRAIDLRTVLQEGLRTRGIAVAFGGSDTHMLIADIGSRAPQVSLALERAGILQNPNILPNDIGSKPTGIRFGTIGAAQVGLRNDGMAMVAEVIADVVQERIDVMAASKCISNVVSSYSGSLGRSAS